ncbi:unnamed protein product [Ectocarpus sp. 12 AP-2014]
MDGDTGSGSARPDERGSAVTSGDATKLAELVLLWSGSKPKLALSILRDCVSLLEREVGLSAPGCSPLPSLPTAHGPARDSCLNAIIVALNEKSDGELVHFHQGTAAGIVGVSPAETIRPCT